LGDVEMDKKSICVHGKTYYVGKNFLNGLEVRNYERFGKVLFLYVVSGINTGKHTYHRLKVLYDLKTGRPYFNLYTDKVYLDEMEKVCDME
jgi:hypothetical protein